jgi:hypothetical protein
MLRSLFFPAKSGKKRVLQCVKIIHFQKEIDRMNRMNRIPKEQNDRGLVRALSCKSCASCPKHLFWLRLAALGVLRLFAANPQFAIRNPQSRTLCQASENS